MIKENVIAACNLYTNEQKRGDTHPDLKGNVVIDGKKYDVALWTRQTMDGSRIYHSATIRELYRKGRSSQEPPILKGAKLYEFRKRKTTDPDYQTRPVEILGGSCCLAMWIVVQEGVMEFRLQILSAPYSEAMSEAAAETLAMVRDRVTQRNRELVEEHADSSEGGRGEPGDDINF